MSERTSHSISNNEIIRRIFEDENIGGILSSLGLPGLEVLKVEERLHDYNHTSVKFQLTREGQQKGGKLLIDMTSRQPSLLTLYDAIYGFGADCSGRIILFTEEKVGEDERDMNTLEKLTASMNSYGAGICLARITPSKERLGIQSISHPTIVPSSRKIEAPTKEQFIQAEFWVRYYCPDYLENDCSECDIDVKSEFGEWIWLNGIQVEVHWNEYGAVFIANDEQPHSRYIQSSWEKYMGDIVTAFKGSEVKYSITPGRLPSISVRVWKTPVSDLIGTSELEKKGYGELLYGKFHRFSEMMEGFLLDLKKGKNGLPGTVQCAEEIDCLTPNRMSEEDC